MTHQTTEVPTGWLLGTLKLLNEMAGEGITIIECDDPADLMTEIAGHLGVDPEENYWEGAIMKITKSIRHG